MLKNNKDNKDTGKRDYLPGTVIVGNCNANNYTETGDNNVSTNEVSVLRRQRRKNRAFEDTVRTNS